MFCKYCGHELSDDSIFCEYCGERLGKIYRHKRDKSNGFEKLVKVSNYIFYFACASFIFFWNLMAPGIGNDHKIYFLIGAVLVIGLAVLFQRIERRHRDRTDTNFYKKVLYASATVFLISLSLRIVYETKIDMVECDIPGKGDVFLSISFEGDIYSDDNKYVRHLKPSIWIGNDYYVNGDVALVTLNQMYPITVSVEYDYEYEVGSKDTQTLFTAGKLFGGYSIVEKIPSKSSVLGEVTVTFTRVISFWKVITY